MGTKWEKTQVFWLAIPLIPPSSWGCMSLSSTDTEMEVNFAPGTCTSYLHPLQYYKIIGWLMLEGTLKIVSSKTLLWEGLLQYDSTGKIKYFYFYFFLILLSWLLLRRWENKAVPLPVTWLAPYHCFRFCPWDLPHRHIPKPKWFRWRIEHKDEEKKVE